MLLGKVLGTVVSTIKDEELEGLKFLLVQAASHDGTPSGATVVCADAVGAGEGELVLYAAGSSARQTKVTQNRPVDHVIMAIVDEIAADGDLTYQKYPSSSVGDDVS
jgi:microcompartment protein CcmK/EutM